MTRPGPCSGLIVQVPEAEPVVGPHRRLLDANAALGVPAHVTVLFPFMAPGQIGDLALGTLRALFATVPAFDYAFDHTDWFGEDVVWLGPRDPGPFRALTQRVVEVFPEFPPFEGQFADSIPHLTLGHAHPVEDLRTAESRVRPRLPITGHASTVTLMTQQTIDGTWRTAATFFLAPRLRVGD